MTTDNNSTDPMCCGEPMVSYQGGWFWECAVSYFALLDDEAIEDDGATPPRLRDEATDEHNALHAHLVATRVGSQL